MLIPAINKNIKGAPLKYGELLQWIGLWLIMGTMQGFQQRNFWSSCNMDMFATAPYWFNDIMSRNQFEAILTSLTFTDKTAPAYKDPFFEVRQMINEWNKNMFHNFEPRWISCLDKSIMKWINAFTCPGFIFILRKPWPFENKFYIQLLMVFLVSCMQQNWWKERTGQMKGLIMKSISWVRQLDY